MSSVLLTLFSELADPRLDQGKIYPLAPILLFTVLGMLAGARSYRQVHAFIQTHLDRLKSGVWAVVSRAPAPACSGRRGCFDPFHDRKAAHLLSAFAADGQIILGHLAIAEKSNEIPAAQEMIATLGLTGRLFTLDAMHCQKNLMWTAEGEQDFLVRRSAKAAPMFVAADVGNPGAGDGQSRPNPRGGSIACSSARSKSQITCNASASRPSCRLGGSASSQAAYC